MNQYKYILVLVLSFVLFCGTALGADDAQTQAPLNEVRSTVDLLVKAVEQYPGDNNLQERRNKLRQIITPKFDFAQMAKLSLGAHWKELVPEQQNEFVAVFSDLLASTYLSRIENIRADTVKVDGQSFTNPEQATVKTTVTHKGDKFPLNYRLVKGTQGWKVYDVIIENIGLVVNYRNEFAGIIRKEQFTGLMKRLREKTGTSS